MKSSHEHSTLVNLFPIVVTIAINSVQNTSKPTYENGHFTVVVAVYCDLNNALQQKVTAAVSLHLTTFPSAATQQGYSLAHSSVSPL